MTPADLLDILIRDLMKKHGGSAARWRKVIGRLKIYSRSTHAHCNWEVRPSGSAQEIELVERAADNLRSATPFINER